MQDKKDQARPIKNYVKSKGGFKFIQYAKGPTSAEVEANRFDIHEKIAADIGNMVLSETWRRGSEICPKISDRVIDVDGINLMDEKFKFTKDHSKYLLEETSDNNKYTVCIGDINRMV